jgi:hypothetical protein
LDHQIDALVENGWFPSRERVLPETIPRFLEAHRPEVMEPFLREDVAWSCVAEADVGALVVCDTGPLIHLARQS